jgi:maltose alpha-D-glucosyltransferase / alpha-amylase
MFMGLRMEDRFPITDILADAAIPETCQWALFLRNHDELTLEMVTDEERDYMYRVYAQDPRCGSTWASGVDSPPCSATTAEESS